MKKYNEFQRKEIRENMRRIGGGPEARGICIEKCVEANCLKIMIDDGYLKHYFRLDNDDAEKFAEALLKMCNKSPEKKGNVFRNMFGR